MRFILCILLNFFIVCAYAEEFSYSCPDPSEIHYKKDDKNDGMEFYLNNVNQSLFTLWINKKDNYKTDILSIVFKGAVAYRNPPPGHTLPKQNLMSVIHCIYQVNYAGINVHPELSATASEFGKRYCFVLDEHWNSFKPQEINGIINKGAGAKCSEKNASNCKFSIDTCYSLSSSDENSIEIYIFSLGIIIDILDFFLTLI